VGPVISHRCVGESLCRVVPLPYYGNTVGLVVLRQGKQVPLESAQAKKKFVRQIPPTTRLFTQDSTGSSGALICEQHVLPGTAMELLAACTDVLLAGSYYKCSACFRPTRSRNKDDSFPHIYNQLHRDEHPLHPMHHLVLTWMAALLSRFVVLEK
jgi:hypothetical protein